MNPFRSLRHFKASMTAAGLILPEMEREMLLEVLHVYLDGEKFKKNNNSLSSEWQTMDMDMDAPPTPSTENADTNDRWMQEMLSPEKPLYGFDEVLQRLTSSSASPPPPPSPTDAYQVNKRKCWTCQKKLALTPMSCKCCFTFCASHRYPESHACTFDFKQDGKRKLDFLNPPLKAAKLVRL